MKPRVSLGLLVAGLFGCWLVALPAAPVPKRKEKPALTCEMRWVGGTATSTLGGKAITWDVPDAAEVTITNASDEGIDIGDQCGPVAHLDLRVEDPAGKAVATEPLCRYLSAIKLGPNPHILKPGKSEVFGVDLLGEVAEEKRVPGVYTVTAVYTVDGKEYTSNPVRVTWPWKTK